MYTINEMAYDQSGNVAAEITWCVADDLDHAEIVCNALNEYYDSHFEVHQQELPYGWGEEVQS